MNNSSIKFPKKRRYRAAAKKESLDEYLSRWTPKHFNECSLMLDYLLQNNETNPEVKTISPGKRQKSRKHKRKELTKLPSPEKS